MLLLASAVAGCRERYEPGDASAPDSATLDAERPMEAGPDAAESADAGPPDLGADLGPGDAARDLGAADAGPACVGPPGLYQDGSCTVLAAGVRRFVPRFPLWSDGAEKERFFSLPAGSQIDTSDPDAWIYPVGTTFWKTFRRNGLRVETRINRKERAGTGPSAWSLRTFAWNAEQSGVTEVFTGVQNALGTPHDIPSVDLCAECHRGAARDVGLGFTAIQLNHVLDNPTSLADLVAEGALSVPIATSAAVVPGPPATRDALGYMHSNCGPCHGGPMPQPVGFGMELWVRVGTTDVTQTGAYRTAVGRASAWPGTAPAIQRVAPGLPADSAVVRRMEQRGSDAQMPPIATETPDAQGLALVRAWIQSLN